MHEHQIKTKEDEEKLKRKKTKDTTWVIKLLQKQWQCQENEQNERIFLKKESKIPWQHIIFQQEIDTC